MLSPIHWYKDDADILKVYLQLELSLAKHAYKAFNPHTSVKLLHDILTV